VSRVVRSCRREKLLTTSATQLGMTVAEMSEKHADGELGFDSEIDWKPVKLEVCWRDVIVIVMTIDVRCGRILHAPQWSECWLWQTPENNVTVV
jgi:hypothetical protein